MDHYKTSDQRQRVLADFGDFVLDHDDLDDILNEACRLVAAALGTDLAKVMEIDRDSNTGFVRAGVGWRPGIVGHERVSLTEESSESYAIEKTEPVITNDLAHEKRFVFPRFLMDHGVVALVNVPIYLPGRKPFGILQVDAREPREFGQEEIEFLKTYSMVLGPVIDRLKTAAELRATDERLRLVVENARSYVLIVSDAEDRITDWLGGSEKILGWTAEEAIGQGAEIIFTDSDRAAGMPQRECATAREKGSAANVRWHRRKDGSRVFLDGQTIALRDHAGQLRGYYKIGQDNTERKRNEERQGFLLSLSELLRALGDAEEIVRLALEKTAEVFGVDRVVYGEFGDGMLTVRQECARNAPSILGRHNLRPLGTEFLARYRPGAVIRSDDVTAEPGLDADARANLAERQVAAFMDYVLFEEGGHVTFIGVQNSSPRPWSPSDDYLIREIGDRLRSTLERARTEAALREMEVRLHQFVEASSDILWMRDADTLQWDYVSKSFEPAYGRPLGEVRRGDDLENWKNLIVEGDRDAAVAGLKRVQAGEKVTLQYRIRRPDGEIRWIRDTSFPIRGPDGRVERVGGIGQDVTEIMQAQERLEQSEERLSSAVEVGKLGLWDWHIPTDAVHWSNEHFRMEGYEVGEVQPSYENWAARVHREDLPRAEAALREAMHSRKEYVHEFRSVHPDGSEHWLSARGRFFYDDAGRPLRMIGAMIDTTERRSWEERQKVLVAELQHRTRNLMGVVKSLSERTARRSRDLSDFRQRFRDRIEALARVQGLLSRLDTHDRVTFDELIASEMEAMAAGSTKVRTSGPGGIRLRSSTVQTLAMALHELATNAVKYGALGQEGGRLSVSWSLAEGEDGKPWLHVEWRESGVTMPPEGSTPQGSGQGRELIERALPYQLKARTSYRHSPDGVHCDLTIPVSRTMEDDDHGE
jgi:PAS domain S-box-containing protein